MSDRDVPFWVTVSEPEVEPINDQLADLNLGKTAEQPGMAMTSLDELSPRNSAADIAEVTDPDGLDEFNRVAAQVFGAPLGVAEQVYQGALVEDKERLFLGRVNGHTAACGQLIQSEDVAGVYSVGVFKRFRRQGIGEAMSWEVLRAGRKSGCHVGVLQSSDKAYPLYKKMGFETGVTYHHFESAD